MEGSGPQTLPAVQEGLGSRLGWGIMLLYKYNVWAGNAH